MKKTNIVVAIDGFSSCGKSTLAKQLAKELGFAYIDSGAMYRAITLHFLKNEVDLTDETSVQSALNTAKITFSYLDGENKIFLNDQDVSNEIRKMYVSETVSKVSPIPSVRNALVRQQQELGKEENIVMDGRDIGTHVFPNAEVKLFMTADPKVRAERRYKELCAKSEEVTLEAIMANLEQRDHDDMNRTESPLVCAADAILIDNSFLTMEEQFNHALSKIKSLTLINL